MSEKKQKKQRKQDYYRCCICGKKINPDSLYIGNYNNFDKKCLKCSLGVERVQ